MERKNTEEGQTNGERERQRETEREREQIELLIINGVCLPNYCYLSHHVCPTNSGQFQCPLRPPSWSTLLSESSIS